LRLAFFGSPPFADPAFAALLASGLEVVGLVTSPPRRSGRGRREAENPLVTSAEAHGLPVLRPESARDATFKQDFAAWQVDVGVVVSYGQLLDQELLDLPRQGCLNLHGSLLPRWRGASPVQAALLAGDEVTGVCLQRMVLALDAGPVVAARETAIAADEEAPALFARLSELGAALTVDFLQEVADGGGVVPAGEAQDEAAVTVCRKIRKEDGCLDWSLPAAEVERRVRAMAGWPCGQTALPDGSGLKVHRGRMVAGAGAPGTVLEIGDSLVVACGDGAYAIEELQREGKARMAAADFLRGADLTPGALLVEPA
jgi:methionyl-tRNA formyltransferase